MKKIITITAIALGFMANAQQAKDKKVQYGLSMGEGVNLNASETKLMEVKTGNDFSIGVNIHWHFGDKIGLSTGPIFDIESYKVNTTAGNELFYFYDDKKVFQNRDVYTNDKVDTSLIAYEGILRLKNRKQKAKYLTIPTMLTFQTQFYGYWRYFAKAGLRNSFLIGNQTDDTGDIVDKDLSTVIQSNVTLEGMKPEKELSFYKGALGIGGGAEWNFSGSTSVVAELGYYYGFTPIYRKDAIGGNNDRNKSLFTNDLQFKHFDSSQQQILLKISLLF